MALSPWSVCLAAIVTTLATGLGAAPFALVGTMDRKWLGVSNALAAGFMLAASLALLSEGVKRSVPGVGAGILAGLVAMSLTRKLLGHRPGLQFGAFEGADALQAVLILGVMLALSTAEGVGVGVAFGAGKTLGLLITAVIAVENVPQGLAISLVLVPRGESALGAAAWSVFSSLPQVLLAVPAFLFVRAFEPFLPGALGFASGALIWMSFSDLVPEALAETSRKLVILVLVTSAVAMVAVQGLILWF
jgi:zinc transporter ZupT